MVEVPAERRNRFLKSTAQVALNAVSPALLREVLAWRARSRCERLYGPRAESIRERLYAEKPVEVLDGPFKGLKFVERSNLGPIIPKWVGTYESQLRPIIESIICSGDYRTVINVGAAEGYYSVGLAWRLPRSQVFSYDIDPHARRTQRHLAHTNGVTNLTICSRCSHPELTRRIEGKTLLITDIEGCEYEFLDPLACPTLTRVDILVELHPALEPNPLPWYRAEPDREKMIALAEAGRCELISRFARSHWIRSIQEAPPDTQIYETLSKVLPSNEVQSALSEDRSFPMTWLWMEAKGEGKALDPAGVELAVD